MSRSTLRLFIFLISIYVTCSQRYLSVINKELRLNDEKVYLSGMNEAWIHYAEDFGNGKYNASKARLYETLDVIHKSGGNSIRIWLHISGVNTPNFNGSGFVTGIDQYLIDDLTDYLTRAQEENILVNLVLWNCALKPAFRLNGLIYDVAKLKSYLDNALRPMVRALRKLRALGSWEIINEPEGCVAVDRPDPEPCFDTTRVLHITDFADWTEAHIPMKNLLHFISLQANAIHEEDEKALVTVGSWTYRTITDKHDRRNFYKDACLRKAGNVSGGHLDYYQVHTYATLGFYWPDDPYKHNASFYSCDKPLVIGEFSQKKGGGMTSEQQFYWAYERGYSGSWSWCGNPHDSAADAVATQERGMNTLKDKNDQSKGGRVNINIRGSERTMSFIDIVTIILWKLFSYLRYVFC